ncbi:MAG TPA: DUF4266 domain-containing protein [Steroidobacteraceae bacterium]|nr:DUF4266 domain-containing protein [Steroidobacteraceae bacterium]
MSLSRRIAGLAAALMLLAQLAACAPIQPWVKPYERERLADPIMAFDPNPVSSAYMEHVFEVRSAARGGNGAAGGGCGCN